MFRKYVIVTFAVMMCLGTSSCTSKKAEEQGSDVEVSANDDALEEADAKENNSDLDTGSSSGGDVAASDDLGGSELDDLGGDTKADSGSAVADSGGEVTANDLDAPPADTAAPPPDAAPPADDMAAASADTPPPSDVASSEPPPPEPEAAATVPVTTVDSGASEEPRPATGSLQKIKSSPEKIGKTLVNAVYIARDGDSVESIAQKVGVKQKDLCRANSYNCSRPAKVGDKFYYNSPQRPTDDTVVKTFYEDAGLQPEVYVAKSGDNIRKVGKELLGHDRSWMEIWATNDVESKGDLEEGVQLKYWPKTDVAAPAQTVAAAETAPPAPTDAAPPAPPADQGQPMATEAPPPPPPTDQPPQQAANDLPPTPDPNAAGMVEPPPPPPPPPPADAAAAPPADAVAGAAGQDPDQTMMLGVGAVLLLAAAALFISIRKKRQRRQIDFNTTTQTQIE